MKIDINLSILRSDASGTLSLPVSSPIQACFDPELALTAMRSKCSWLMLLSSTVCVFSGCSDGPAWRRSQFPAVVSYGSYQVMGVSDARVELAGSDTIWVFGRGMLLFSFDGGVHWSKRLIKEMESWYSSGSSVAIQGSKIWMVAECRIIHSTDTGVRWVRSPSLPDCAEYDNAGLEPQVAVAGGHVWVVTRASLFEIDSRLTRWTEHGSIPTNSSNGFVDLTASSERVWVLDMENRLYSSPAGSAEDLKGHSILSDGSAELVQAVGDTVWVVVKSSSRADTLPASVPSEYLIAVVADSAEPKEVSRLALTRSGVGQLYPRRGYAWAYTNNGLARLDSSGLMPLPSAVGEDTEVRVYGNMYHAVVVTKAGVTVLDPTGRVVGRAFEPAASICAVQQRSGGWTALLSDGRVARGDSSFVWEQPTATTEGLELHRCAFDRRIWAVGRTHWSSTSLFRWDTGRWTPVLRLPDDPDGIYDTWIHTSGSQVWAYSPRGEIDRLRYSDDDGQRWTERPLGQLVEGSLHGTGSRVWALVRLPGPDSLTRLQVLAGERFLDRLVPVPNQSVDAWISEDSIWVATGSDRFRFSPDWGRSWEDRHSPVAGAPVSAIYRHGPILVIHVEVGEGSTEVYMSTDGGLTWNTDVWLSSPIPSQPTSKYLWHGGVFGTPEVIAPRWLSPRIARYRIRHALTRVNLELELDGSAVTPQDSVAFELAGVDAHDRARGEYDEFENACHEETTRRWTCSFSPEQAGIRPGEEGHLLLTLRSGDFQHAFVLPPFTFRPWWQQLPTPLLWTLALYAAVLLMAAALLLARPLWLHTVYWFLHRNIDRLPAVGGAVGRTVLNCLLPFYAHHPRVLDAWVEQHVGGVAHAIRSIDTRLVPPEQYVPLPLDVLHAEMGMAERLVAVHRITEPTAESFRPFFRTERTLMEIVGSGGSGKTTLALRIAAWALGASGANRVLDDRLAAHRILPIVLDEELDDLLMVATRQLRAWTGEEVVSAFVSTLLRKGRALIIVDRLSERSAATQRYVRSAHGRLKLTRMLVTTRVPISFEAPGATYVGTRELTFDSLARLVSARLAVIDRDPAGRPDEVGRPHPCWDAEAQAQLAIRITRLFRVSANGSADTTIPLQPLLVRLAVDEAVALRRAGAPAPTLAPSIPRLIENYLKSLNPADAEEHGLSDEEMLRAVQIAAKLELGTAFRPRSFSRVEARTEFARNNWNIADGPDPLRRLILNGVLLDEGAGYLRFRLDPVAEYVAADAEVQERGRDPAAWRALLERVNGAGASTFYRLLVALRRIRFPQDDLSVVSSDSVKPEAPLDAP